MQDGRPIWFASRTLTPLERKYDTREKEAIGVRFGLEKFKPYYYPNHVTVFNDHGNLRWLMEQQQSGRLARWQLDLQQYNFTISYVRGVNNPVADCLSRDIDTQVQLMAMTRSRNRIRAVVNEEDVEEDSSLRTYFGDINWYKEQSKDPELRKERQSPSSQFMLKNGVVYRFAREQDKKVV